MRLILIDKQFHFIHEQVKHMPHTYINVDTSMFMYNENVLGDRIQYHRMSVRTSKK